MKYALNNREVQVNHIHGSLNEEVFVDEALFIDTGEHLTDKELDEFINMYYSELNEELLMKMIGQAESYYEGDR